MTTKESIRREIIARRKAMTDEECTQKSKVICEHLEKSELFKSAQNVLFFASHKNEPDILPLAKKYFLQKNILFPRVKDALQKTMEIRHVQKNEDLCVGAFGILEPKLENTELFDPQKIDLLIIPAVSIDEKGNRLGYGGGFFDRFLYSLPGFLLGVIFADDYREKLPSETHDIRLHGYVSEEKCVLF